ncbi:MAG TPA: DUF971 domain-containing protein [Rhodobacteraceae bacterium]|nr:DUF971 domain-containing protein [Paracoccaceae bacterium]
MTAAATTTSPWPTEIRSARGGAELNVSFDSGESFTYSAELLRVESPSAEVQGHSPEEKKTVPGKRHVRIKAIEPAGNYAVVIRFDDGHDTGLFSWDYLHALGQQQDEVWQAYVQRLEEEGLSRDK